MPPRKFLWTINDIVEIAKTRQKQKFDFNIIVSGARGNGKSTMLYKFFSRFDAFRPKKHIVYSRRDVIKLLESQKFGCIFDDEAIRSSYKRQFYDKDQQTLIQMLNMYRDNFNIYGIAVPNFYSLDKDIRDVMKMHIHVIERGLAVIHIPNESSLYSEDKWEVAYNKKIEERWAKRKLKNPNYSPPYHKLSTFMGYLQYGDLTKKQRELYEEIKKTKRKEVYEQEMRLDPKSETNFYDKVVAMLYEGEVSEEELVRLCRWEGKKYSSVRNMLNQKLKDLGKKEKLADLLCTKETLVNKKIKSLHSTDHVENLEEEQRLKVV